MKKLLIAADCQKDMFESLSDRSVEERICDVIDRFRSEECEIIFTLDSHDEDYYSTAESEVNPALHCLVNTEGWQMQGKIGERLTTADTVFIKPVCGSLELGNHIKETGYDEIYLCGLMTSGAVLANAVIAANALPNARVKILAKACADCDETAAKTALDAAKKLGIKIS